MDLNYHFPKDCGISSSKLAVNMAATTSIHVRSFDYKSNRQMNANSVYESESSENLLRKH